MVKNDNALQLKEQMKLFLIFYNSSRSYDIHFMFFDQKYFTYPRIVK